METQDVKTSSGITVRVLSFEGRLSRAFDPKPGKTWKTIMWSTSGGIEVKSLFSVVNAPELNAYSETLGDDIHRVTVVLNRDKGKAVGDWSDAFPVLYAVDGIVNPDVPEVPGFESGGATEQAPPAVAREGDTTSQDSLRAASLNQGGNIAVEILMERFRSMVVARLPRGVINQAASDLILRDGLSPYDVKALYHLPPAPGRPSEAATAAVEAVPMDTPPPAPTSTAEHVVAKVPPQRRATPPPPRRIVALVDDSQVEHLQGMSRAAGIDWREFSTVVIPHVFDGRALRAIPFSDMKAFLDEMLGLGRDAGLARVQGLAAGARNAGNN